MTSHKKDNNKMQQSPIKDKDFSELQENKHDLINKLEYLFTYYASKLSRHNYRELSHKAYMNMMEALLSRGESALNTRITEQRREYDLLRSAEILYFSKGNKEGATFQQFLEMIPGLGRIVYAEIKNRIEQTEMITKDLLALYRKEVEKKIQGKYIDLDLVLEQQTTRYIIKLAPEFLKIYKTYFSHEINKNIKFHDVKDESIKSFFKFLKQFQVFPKLITAGEICFIHKQVLEKRDTELLDKQLKESFPYEDYKNNTGMVFTLGKMITALVVISKIANEKIKSSEEMEESEKDGLRTLLEYIEMTKAYKKERFLKDTGKSFSFILLEEYPKELIKPAKLLAKDGKEITPKKEIQFLKILKKMDI